MIFRITIRVNPNPATVNREKVQAAVIIIIPKVSSVAKSRFIHSCLRITTSLVATQFQ